MLVAPQIHFLKVGLNDQDGDTDIVTKKYMYTKYTGCPKTNPPTSKQFAGNDGGSFWDTRRSTISECAYH